MDPIDSATALAAALPEELKCQAFSWITKIDDVTRLISTSRDFRRVGLDCIEVLESDKEIFIRPDFLVQFPNLRRLNNVIVQLNSVDDAVKMASLIKIQRTIFLIKNADESSAITSAYVNTLCANVTRSLIGRQLYFVTQSAVKPRPSGFSLGDKIDLADIDVLALDGPMIWERVNKATPNRGLLDLLTCTGLQQAYISTYHLVDRQSIAEILSPGVRTINYRIEYTLVNDRVLAYLQASELGGEPGNRTQDHLNVFTTHFLDKESLQRLFIMSFVTSGNAWNFDYYHVPESFQQIFPRAFNERRRKSRYTDMWIRQVSLLNMLNGFNAITTYGDLIKQYSPNKSPELISKIEADKAYINRLTTEYFASVRQVLDDPEHSIPIRTSAYMLPGTEIPFPPGIPANDQDNAQDNVAPE